MNVLEYTKIPFYFYDKDKNGKGCYWVKIHDENGITKQGVMDLDKDGKWITDTFIEEHLL